MSGRKALAQIIGGFRIQLDGLEIKLSQLEQLMVQELKQKKQAKKQKTRDLR